jgi:hypothetical protein
MIDNGDPGTWQSATLPDHRSLKLIPHSDLHSPFIYENVRRWHGLATLGEARDMVAAECKRRTTTTGSK